MKLEYSKRAVADIDSITEYFIGIGESGVGRDVEAAIRHAAERIARIPHFGSPVRGISNVRMTIVRRYRYKIFYRVAGTVVRVLHIRHTSRSPWTND